MTGGERSTIGDRENFVDIMCTEIRRVVEERRKASRARALFSGIGGCEGCADGECTLDHGVQDVFSVQPGSARPGSTQQDRQSTMRTPGGGWQRHPCVRCRSTTHPRGHRCTVQVTCGTCNGDHLDDYCWIKNGIQLYNRRVPPEVAQQYEQWHQQHLAGTYQKVTGGPPRVRIGGSSRAANAVYDGYEACAEEVWGGGGSPDVTS